MKIRTMAAAIGSYIQNLLLNGDVAPATTSVLYDWVLDMKDGIFYIGNKISIKKRKNNNEGEIGRIVIPMRRDKSWMENNFRFYTWKTFINSIDIDNIISFDKGLNGPTLYGVFLCANEANIDMDCHYVSFNDLKRLIDYDGDATRITIVVKKAIKVGGTSMVDITSKRTGDSKSLSIASVYDPPKFINW